MLQAAPLGLPPSRCRRTYWKTRNHASEPGKLEPPTPMGIMLTTGDGPIDLVDHSCLSTIFSRGRFTNQTSPRPPYPDRARVGTDFSTPIHPQKPCTCAKEKCAHMRKDAQTAHILSGRYAQNGSSDILRKPSKKRRIMEKAQNAKGWCSKTP